MPGSDMAGKEAIVLSWSGGKDSMMALQRLREGGAYDVVSLLTTVTSGVDRVSMHGVRLSLIEKQAQALDVPLETVMIPASCSNEEYEKRMTQFLTTCQDRGIRAIAFGDLFLQDIRRYREKNMASMGMRAVFPIWGEPTREFANDFMDRGFKARVVCVDTAQMEGEFCGQSFEDVVSRLPPNVDPCGENGEFHTFVHDGPSFREPLEVEVGERIHRPPFVFIDLVELVR